MPLRMKTGVRVAPTAVPPSPLMCSFQPQIRPKWCWAACVAMVVDSVPLAQRPTQCQIASAFLNASCCGLPAISCVGAGTTACDHTADPNDIDALWQSNGISAQRLERSLTAAELETHMTGTHKTPVMVYLEGGNAAFDHVMLVVGKQDGWFVVADPCLSNFTVATHEELLTARAGWTKTWTNLR